MRLAVFTVCSNQSVPQARVLFATVSQFLADADQFLILADECDPAVPYPDGCTVIAARTLGIPDFAGLAFRYDRTEFSAAVKPFAFLHLLGPRGYTHCLYFDPDIELFSALPEVTRALEADAAFLLTPHILAPAEQDRGHDDVTVMRAGVYNLGFLGVSGTPEARDRLGWWARWLRSHCVDDRPIGLFVDQKFIDLMPGLAPGVRILRDPGLNVAHWNLSQRRFVPDGPNGPEVDSGPLGFFHYSGFDPSRPDQLSAETEAFRDGDLPGAWRGFLASYAGRLQAAGHRSIPAGGYAYGRFASGVPIPVIARRLFRDDHPAWAGDPFETFETWLHLPARDAVLSMGSAIPSLVMQWLQARNPALVHSPLSDPAGSARVTRWWLEHGVSIGIDRRFLEPQALAAGLRPVSVAARGPPPCPPFSQDRADATVIAPFGEASPAGEVGRAQQDSLRLAAGQVETCDSLTGGAQPPLSGRLLAFCLSPDRLAPTLDSVKPLLPERAYRVFIPSAERLILSPPCRDALHAIDEIWAPTRFIQAALVLETERPVLHMPMAWHVPAAATAASGRPYILVEPDGFPGGDPAWAALRAYEAAFGAQLAASRPALVIRAQPNDPWDDALRAAIAAHDGVIMPDSIMADPADGMALVAGAACILSLHRGEALGMSIVRAMTRGVPVVATDYGGCTDLLTPETGYPVDFHLVPARREGMRDEAWADADLDHAAWSLRDVFARPDAAQRRAGHARDRLEAAHSPTAVAARQARRLEVLGLVARPSVQGNQANKACAERKKSASF
jgi:hypothetical protein